MSDKKHTGKHGKFTVGEQSGVIRCEGDSPPADRIPEGWVETEPGVFRPQWPDCRYRRLNIKMTRKDPIQITPLCIYENRRGDPVSVDICQNCTVHKPPIIVPLLTKQQQEDVTNGNFDTLADLTDDEKKQIREDIVRRKDFDKRTGQNKSLPTPWKPCIHRHVVTGEEGCCPKQYCHCVACPLLNKRLNKSDCEDCTHRAES